MGLLALYLSEVAKATDAVQGVLDETDDTAHFQTRGMLVRELELLRTGRSKTPEARALSRELADVFAPSRYLQAAW